MLSDAQCFTLQQSLSRVFLRLPVHNAPDAAFFCHCANYGVMCHVLGVSQKVWHCQ